MAAKIKKGDRVIMLTGKDKGRAGEVIRVMPKENRALVRGVNVVGLQRNGFSEDDIRALKEAYKTIYRKNLNVADAIAVLKEKHSDDGDDSPMQELIQFVESSERGIIR